MIYLHVRSIAYNCLIDSTKDLTHKSTWNKNQSLDAKLVKRTQFQNSTATLDNENNFIKARVSGIWHHISWIRNRFEMMNLFSPCIILLSPKLPYFKFLRFITGRYMFMIDNWNFLPPSKNITWYSSKRTITTYDQLVTHKNSVQCYLLDPITAVAISIASRSLQHMTLWSKWENISIYESMWCVQSPYCTLRSFS